MNKLFKVIILILFSIVIVSCGKDDSNLSDDIFNEYKIKLEDAGYELNKVDASNNVSGWLEITDDDVVRIYRTNSDKKDGILYMYLFPTIKQSGKWYDKIKDHVLATNYKAYLDGHYVIVVLGDDLNKIALNKSE